MASSTEKRKILEQDEHGAAKKTKVLVEDDHEAAKESKPTERVVLNPADCNLDFNIEGNGLQGSALYEQGFSYCWSGARANVGITRGKYCFGCKIISVQPVDMEDTAPDQHHVCRVGISRGDDNVGNLGETEHSFGFGGLGKFSSARKFLDYGEKFGIGDTIVCAVNLEDKPLACIGFSKNGKWLGIARQFNAGPKGLAVVDSPTRKLQWESALFPHILLKNVVVDLQFSVEEGLIPEEGYKPWASALKDGNAMMGPTFSKPSDCELMMMVGLPASGKTTWAEKWVKEHPEKRYVLLGTNLILDQMKVPGLTRKQNYGERFDRLMDRATAIFNTLLPRAAKTPRNYIIDQTNVYKNARKRKLKPFAYFQKIAVVVFPKPEELKFRADKRFKEMGKEVPADAVNEMLANFVLPGRKDMPGSDEYFDQVIFVELNRAESQRHLDEMKNALAAAPNLNSNNSSPYSREGSIQPYTGFMPQHQGSLAATGGHWQSSYAPPPPYNYQGPNQVNTTYQGAKLQGRTGSYAEAYQGNQYPPVAIVAPPPGTYSSYESSIPRDNTGYSGSYAGTPSSGTAPNWGYGMGGPPYSGPKIEAMNAIPAVAIVPYRSSMVEHPPFGSASTMPFSHSSHGEHFSNIGGPGAALQAPRAPSYLPRPPPVTCGSPYGTPIPRPSYGSNPTDGQYTGGYALPHPKYY
ncbi:hypothetical protein ACB098_05G197800 [Castanea mollissima]|uniref:SPRY domain-containing protein n=1 Tax=Castanea mollissima TaxID=60419 RepID=A0A8J4VAN9_9ROSI|nr:hypothetical protein CMV_020154 [Castanea mollissima]